MAATTIDHFPSSSISAQAVSQEHEFTHQLNRLEERDWWTNVKRFVLPGYAKAQDAQITHYFLKFFKEVVSEKRSFSSTFVKQVIALADAHVGYRVDPAAEKAPKEVADLERYTFAARIRLNYFDSDAHKASLRGAIERHHRSLFAKWDRMDFGVRPEDKDAFWTHPDMVDFIFKLHLHRHIRHADYLHKIQMQPIMNQRDGRWVVEWEAHLKMNGKMTKWSEIRNLLKIDDEEALYSTDAQGNKTYWMYLDDGFVPHDRFDMEHLRRFKKLERAPASCQVELITTHAPLEKWHLGDRVLQGARHTFFRVIMRQNFQRDHASSPYRDGEVYSFGWGAPWREFNALQPLKTLTGKVISPDAFEFYAENLVGTTFDVTDEQALRIMEIVKRRQQEPGRVFNIITSNCASNAVEILREAEVINLTAEDHMLYLWYKFFFPPSWRVYMDRVGNFIGDWTPDLVLKAFRSLGYFLHSIIFVPIFTLIGAWRSEVYYDEESSSLRPDSPHELILRTGNRAKALFSNLYDLFDPKKMTYGLTLNVWDWQKKFAAQHPERTFFVKQA